MAREGSIEAKGIMRGLEQKYVCTTSFAAAPTCMATYYIGRQPFFAIPILKTALLLGYES